MEVRCPGAQGERELSAPGFASVTPAPTFSNSARFVLYACAISGTSGSSGLGSVSSEQIESNTLEMVSAGDLHGGGLGWQAGDRCGVAQSAGERWRCAHDGARRCRLLNGGGGGGPRTPPPGP